MNQSTCCCFELFVLYVCPSQSCSIATAWMIGMILVRRVLSRCVQISPQLIILVWFKIIEPYWTPRTEGLSLSDHIQFPKWSSPFVGAAFSQLGHEKWPQGRCRNAALPQEAPWHPPSPRCPHHVMSTHEAECTLQKRITSHNTCAKQVVTGTTVLQILPCYYASVDCGVWSAACWV